jgi:hypothetical protein
MAIFRKKILKVGNYHAGGNVISITPDRLKNFEAQLEKMRSVGLVQPIHRYHQGDSSTSVPLTEAECDESEKAGRTIGRLKSFRVLPGGEQAEVELSISSPVDQPVIEANDLFLSPVIAKTWRDSRDNVYIDAITAIDAVDHPVDHSQTPFEVVAMSLTDASNFQRFSLEEPQKMELADLIALLRGVGVEIADDATAEAVKAALVKALAEDEPADETKDTPADDPKMVAMSLEIARLRNLAAETKKASLLSRIDALESSGRCTSLQAKVLREKLGITQMSLDSESGVENTIAFAETTPEHVHMSLERRASFEKLKAAQNPLDPEAQAKAVVDEVIRHNPQLFKKQAS